MKLKEDLLERVRKGELIVENDNNEIVKYIFDSGRVPYNYNVFINERWYAYSKEERLIFDQSRIVKASELIEKEDYTKPLERGQLCVFFDNLSSFMIRFYLYRLGDSYSQIDHDGTGWEYAFPYEGQTQAEIQEKINNYLKDK